MRSAAAISVTWTRRSLPCSATYSTARNAYSAVWESIILSSSCYYDLFTPASLIKGSMAPVTALTKIVRRGFARADALANRLYGWRYNPLYHSGALVLMLFVVLLVTGVYLLFVYHISEPYESVARITRQAWLGRWMRGVHRYASDAAVVAALFHALRMLVQGRSGGARIFDLLPIFGEPISRAFTGERALPGAFFFLNLFAHVALPIALFILVWVHVSRLARPGLFPPRWLTWTVVGALLALAVLWPVAMTPQ